MAISGITNHLRSIQLPEAQKTLLKQIEQENFFPIAFEKSRIADRKRSHFQALGHFHLLLIHSFNNFDFVSDSLSGRPLKRLPHTDFVNLEPVLKSEDACGSGIAGEGKWREALKSAQNVEIRWLYSWSPNKNATVHEFHSSDSRVSAT